VMSYGYLNGGTGLWEFNGETPRENRGQHGMPYRGNRILT
jgi:hypothetical protein